MLPKAPKPGGSQETEQQDILRYNGIRKNAIWSEGIWKGALRQEPVEQGSGHHRTVQQSKIQKTNDRKESIRSEAFRQKFKRMQARQRRAIRLSQNEEGYEDSLRQKMNHQGFNQELERQESLRKITAKQKSIRKTSLEQELLKQGITRKEPLQQEPLQQHSETLSHETVEQDDIQQCAGPSGMGKHNVMLRSENYVQYLRGEKRVREQISEEEKVKEDKVLKLDREVEEEESLEEDAVEEDEARMHEKVRVQKEVEQVEVEEDDSSEFNVGGEADDEDEDEEEGVYGMEENVGGKLRVQKKIGEVGEENEKKAWGEGKEKDTDCESSEEESLETSCGSDRERDDVDYAAFMDKESMNMSFFGNNRFQRETENMDYNLNCANHTRIMSGAEANHDYGEMRNDGLGLPSTSSQASNANQSCLNEGQGLSLHDMQGSLKWPSMPLIPNMNHHYIRPRYVELPPPPPLQFAHMRPPPKLQPSPAVLRRNNLQSSSQFSYGGVDHVPLGEQGENIYQARGMRAPNGPLPMWSNQMPNMVPSAQPSSNSPENVTQGNGMPCYLPGNSMPPTYMDQVQGRNLASESMMPPLHQGMMHLPSIREDQMQQNPSVNSVHSRESLEEMRRQEGTQGEERRFQMPYGLIQGQHGESSHTYMVMGPDGLIHEYTQRPRQGPNPESEFPHLMKCPLIALGEYPAGHYHCQEIVYMSPMG